MEGCERGGRYIVLGVEGVHYKAGKGVIGSRDSVLKMFNIGWCLKNEAWYICMCSSRH